MIGKLNFEEHRISIGEAWHHLRLRHDLWGRIYQTRSPLGGKFEDWRDEEVDVLWPKRGDDQKQSEYVWQQRDVADAPYK